MKVDNFDFIWRVKKKEGRKGKLLGKFLPLEIQWNSREQVRRCNWSILDWTQNAGITVFCLSVRIELQKEDEDFFSIFLIMYDDQIDHIRQARATDYRR